MLPSVRRAFSLVTRVMKMVVSLLKWRAVTFISRRRQMKQKRFILMRLILRRKRLTTVVLLIFRVIGLTPVILRRPRLVILAVIIPQNLWVMTTVMMKRVVRRQKCRKSNLVLNPLIGQMIRPRLISRGNRNRGKPRLLKPVELKSVLLIKKLVLLLLTW